MPERARETKRAPEPLHLVQALVNTKNEMRGYDLLDTPADAESWLSEMGYSVRAGLDREDFALLRALREGFRAVLLSHTDADLASAPVWDMAVPELNQLLESTSLAVRFNLAGEPLLTPTSTGFEAFKEDVLIAAIWAQHTGHWPRLKVCANEACRWSFYDNTRNRSGTWCVMQICGSRAKMRKYRQKRSRIPSEPA